MLKLTLTLKTLMKIKHSMKSSQTQARLLCLLIRLRKLYSAQVRFTTILMLRAPRITRMTLQSSVLSSCHPSLGTKLRMNLRSIRTPRVYNGCKKSPRTRVTGHTQTLRFRASWKASAARIRSLMLEELPLPQLPLVTVKFMKRS
jgi:hypothetical protein